MEETTFEHVEKSEENHRKNIKACWSSLGPFIVNVIKRLAEKLRSITLVHFGLVTVRFHYGRNLKPLIFMISGFSEVSMTRQTKYLDL